MAGVDKQNRAYVEYEDLLPCVQLMGLGNQGLADSLERLLVHGIIEKGEEDGQYILTDKGYKAAATGDLGYDSRKYYEEHQLPKKDLDS